MGHYAHCDLKLPGLGNAGSPRREWSGVDQRAPLRARFKCGYTSPPFR